jgi:hypothetical protein
MRDREFALASGRSASPRSSGQEPAPVAGSAFTQPVPIIGGVARDPSTDLDAALVELGRRLQRELEHQGLLIDRAPGADGPADPLAELRASNRRLHRTGELLALVAGRAAPGVRDPGSTTVSGALGRAVAGADDPSRVALRPVPAATVSAAAVPALVHVVGELLDHAAVVASPNTPIQVVSRPAPDGGVVIEVVGQRVPVDPLSGPLPGGPEDADTAGAPGLAVATGVARRAGLGIEPGGAGPAGVGPVAVVHCPPALLDVPCRTAAAPASGPPAPHPVAGGGDLPGGRHNRLPERAPAPGRDAVPGRDADEHLTLPPRPQPPTSAAHPAPAHHPGPLPRRPAPQPVATAVPVAEPVDELFGPITALPQPADDEVVATPIFEAVASAWFQDEMGGAGVGAAPGPVDWHSPGDAEWRDAAERAARPAAEPTTTSGLPQRRPGARLIPSQPPPDAADRAGRVPERVRNRLAVYQQGLRHGRHRATDRPDRDAVAEDDGHWWRETGA